MIRRALDHHYSWNVSVSRMSHMSRLRSEVRRGSRDKRTCTRVEKEASLCTKLYSVKHRVSCRALIPITFQGFQQQRHLPLHRPLSLPPRHVAPSCQRQCFCRCQSGVNSGPSPGCRYVQCHPLSTIPFTQQINHHSSFDEGADTPRQAPPESPSSPCSTPSTPSPSD